jgi:hypothetical protein
MASLPLIILAGEAGTGKDTVGAHIARVFNGVCVAQADPMKRFTAKIFGFSQDQLWGPSENRNAADERTVEERLAISRCFSQGAGFKELLEGVVPFTKRQEATARLNVWFEGLYSALENGLPLSPRTVLQTLGTEWGRAVSRDMWSLYAIETCRQLLGGGLRYTRASGVFESNHLEPAFAVITDGRFRNEVLNTRGAGGVAYKVIRPGAIGVDIGGVKGHVSEAELGGIPPHFFTAMIDNNGTLRDLEETVEWVIAKHFKVRTHHHQFHYKDAYPKTYEWSR